MDKSGSAYPYKETTVVSDGMGHEELKLVDHPGMTKREAFAMAALQGILSGPPPTLVMTYEDICDAAYAYADLMVQKGAQHG